MTIRIFILLFFVFLCSNSFAQLIDSVSLNVNSFFVVDSIQIKGNEITEDYVILEELTFGNGDSVNTTVLDYNRERIYSLGIFTKVQLIPVHSNQTRIIEITVEESWYIYPIPFAELKDKDWNKISYGIDLVVQNFRGRNELLKFRGSLGYEKSLHISYINPNFIKDNNIFLRTSLLIRNAKNKSLIAENLAGYSFAQKNIAADLTIGKRFGLFHRLAISARFDYIETPFYIKGINASDSRIDRYPTIGLTYSYDTRDLVQFPKEGIFFSTLLDFKGIGFNNINYQVLTLDFREYRKIFDELISKWRLTTRQTAGNLIPYYDYSFLGFGERIRGHYSEKHEGDSYYLASLEFIYPLVNYFNLSLDFIPLVPENLLTYRIAVYAQIFGDTGAINFRSHPIGINDFNTGFGAGFTFLFLPYNIIRVETASDGNFNLEYILDIGISF